MGPKFRFYRWPPRPAGLYLKLTLHASSYLRAWNVLSYAPSAHLATTDSSHSNSSNITSLGALPPHELRTIMGFHHTSNCS